MYFWLSFGLFFPGSCRAEPCTWWSPSAEAAAGYPHQGADQCSAGAAGTGLREWDSTAGDAPQQPHSPSSICHFSIFLSCTPSWCFLLLLLSIYPSLLPCLILLLSGPHWRQAGQSWGGTARVSRARTSEGRGLRQTKDSSKQGESAVYILIAF